MLFRSGRISVTQANQISKEVADALCREVTHLDTVFVHIGEGSAQTNRYGKAIPQQ